MLVEIALAIGAVLYRLLPAAIREYVDLDSSLGELLAFGLGATAMVGIAVGLSLVL